MKKLFIGITILFLGLIVTETKAQDSLWAGNFGPTGVYGTVKALKHWGDSLVIGGEISGLPYSSFTTKEFLIFDKSNRSWKRQTVGPSGTNAEVRALEVLGSGNLLLGGDFSFFRDGRTMRHLAVMDKLGNYSSLTGDSTDGFDGPVNALLWHNNRLYIGGEFTQVGSLSVNGFIIWDEDNGFMLPNGILQTFTPDPPVIYTLDYSGAFPDKLLLGGLFDYEDVGYESNLVFFNMNTLNFETTPFSPLGPVHTIFTDTSSTWADKIVVGGEFDNIGVMEIGFSSCKNIAILNLPDSTVTIPSEDLNGPVFTIKRMKNTTQVTRLLVGGEFDTAGSLASGPLAVWETSTNEWRNFGTRPKDGAVYAIDDTRSFIAGEFDYINDTNAVFNIYQMPFATETSWKELGDGLYRTGSSNIHVSDVDAAGYKNYFACGNFNYAGARLVNYVAKWNGDNWEALGDGLNSSPNELLANGDTVYVAGSFLDSASGVPVNQIAMWDGTQWSAMGNGVPGASIIDMEMDTLGNLYVAGSSLYTAGDSAVTGIAMWDGSNWHPVGGPIVSSAQLFVFDIYIDTLTNYVYICGQFESVDGMSSPGVAKWDGSAWHAIGNTKLRTSGAPRTIARSPEGDLIVGGTFSDPNLVYYDSFADDWYAYAGGTLSGYPSDMFSYGCDLFVTGENLQYIEGVYVRNFGRWDGIEWVGFEEGTIGFGDILAMSDYNYSLVLGGEFKVIGSTYAQGFTIWKGLRNPNISAGLHVNAPSYGDTLKYGTVFEIKWDTSTTVDAITLEISYDSAKTWQTIHTNVDAKQGTLPWLVPQKDSTRCIMRISEASAPCANTSGGYFTITSEPNLKVSWLKRHTGSYYDEPFTIGYHNWSWGNTKANCWPDSIASSIPYTGQLASITDSIKNFPDWYSLAWSFGDDWAYKDGSNHQRPKPKSVEYWKNRIGKWGGSCTGFAVTSLLWWIHEPFNSDIYIPNDYLYNFELNTFTRNMVNRHWIYQWGKKFWQYKDEVHESTPWQTLETVRNDMAFSYPRSIDFWWRSWKDKLDTTGTVVDSVWRVVGHSVVPYAIKNIPDTAGIYYIYVYDNNSPNGKNNFFRIDSLNNTWAYPAYSISDSDGTFVPTLPYNEYVGHATDERKSTFFRPNNVEPIVLLASATEQVVISNSSGNQIGWVNNDELNTLPGSFPIFPTDTDYQYDYPQGYVLPDDSYQIDLSHFQSKSTRISLERTTSTYSYVRNDVDSTDVDKVYIGNGISVVNNEAKNKITSLTSITTEGDIDRYVQIDSMAFAQNDSTKVSIDTSGAILIDNIGQAKAYSVILWYSDVNSDSYTQSLTTINLNANSSQKIEPVWNNLESGTLEIQIDNDMNGIYEDTIIADVATDIDDDLGSLIPGTFNLAQNYPNPFNPNTTIAFTLPTKANVQLEIINILGQKIRTLTNTTYPAGQHQLVWDGNADNGKPVSSGVYFYRLKADDFVSTKKMLLLK